MNTWHIIIFTFRCFPTDNFERARIVMRMRVMFCEVCLMVWRVSWNTAFVWNYLIQSDIILVLIFNYYIQCPKLYFYKLANSINNCASWRNFRELVCFHDFNKVVIVSINIINSNKFLTQIFIILYLFISKITNIMFYNNI